VQGEQGFSQEKAQLEKLLHKKNLNYLFNEKFIFII
jgi:hypothetical protein